MSTRTDDDDRDEDSEAEADSSVEPEDSEEGDDDESDDDSEEGDESDDDSGEDEPEEVSTAGARRAADVAGGAAPSGDPRGRLGAGLVLMITLSLPGLLLWSWSRERPVPPREMPALTLSPDAVRAQLAADDALAARAPQGELAVERETQYRATNLAEQRGTDYPGRAELRRRALAAALGALRESEGDDVIAAMRAADVARLEPALRGELPDLERTEVLGGFVRMMRRYGMLEGEEQTAPRFVVRTTFKARWNAMHEMELTDGFSDVELQAYHGWLALHAAGAPLEMRLAALDAYAQAGGERATEARAVLLYDEGSFDDAAAAFTEAYALAPTFRLRNHALAASHPPVDPTGTDAPPTEP